MLRSGVDRLVAGLIFPVGVYDSEGQYTCSTSCGHHAMHLMFYSMLPETKNFRCGLIIKNNIYDIIAERSETSNPGRKTEWGVVLYGSPSSFCCV